MHTHATMTAHHSNRARSAASRPDAGRRLELLLIEDSPRDAAIIERALAAGGLDADIRCVETRDEFIAALEAKTPDAILADFNLPQFNGVSALHLARERAPATPVVIVTGALVDEVAVTMLREGAADYVLKDRLARLVPAVRRAVESARIEAARSEAEEKYRAVFTEAHDGIMLSDTVSGLVVDCNAEFERQCGRSLHVLRKLAPWSLLPLEMQAATQARFTEACEAGAGSVVQTDLRRPDGSDVPVELRLKAITLHAGRYVLSISRDVTERLAADRKLNQQLEELRRFHRVAVDRELRMQELEDEIRRLGPARAAQP